MLPDSMYPHTAGGQSSFSLPRIKEDDHQVESWVFEGVVYSGSLVYSRG